MIKESKPKCLNCGNEIIGMKKPLISVFTKKQFCSPKCFKEFTKKEEVKKKKQFNNKEDYILNEIEELNKEHKQIQKSQLLWIIGIFVGLIFPIISIVCLILMIVNGSKMSKIRKQKEAKQREIDMIKIEKKSDKKI